MLISGMGDCVSATFLAAHPASWPVRISLRIHPQGSTLPGLEPGTAGRLAPPWGQGAVLREKGGPAEAGPLIHDEGDCPATACWAGSLWLVLMENERGSNARAEVGGRLQRLLKPFFRLSSGGEQ